MEELKSQIDFEAHLLLLTSKLRQHKKKKRNKGIRQMESTWIRREGEGGEGKGKEGRGGEGILYDLPVDQGGEGRYIEGKFSAVHGGG